MDVRGIYTEISEKYIEWKNFICAEDLYLFDITQNDLLSSSVYDKQIWFSTVKLALERAIRVQANEECKCKSRWKYGRQDALAVSILQ